MLLNIAQIILTLGFPILAVQLARKYKAFDLIGPVVLCYMGGTAFANLLPVLGVGGGVNPKVAQTITDATVPLAIPLLVFSTDLIRWLKHAQTTAISFGLAILSVVIMSASAYFVLGGLVPDAAKVSGMMVGVYTGGTPNMAAIGRALDVKNEAFVLINGADVVIGGLYFLFLVTLAKPLLGKFLKPFPKQESDVTHEPDLKDLTWRTAGTMGIGLLLSACVVGLSVGLSILIKGKIFVPIVMLGLTAPAIALSLIRWVRELHGTYELGEYLILVFCFAIGSLVNAGELFSKGLNYLAYGGFVMVGSILLHFLFAFLFKIDRDTTIITSTAAIYGPPFVGPIAENLKNKAVIISGLTAGLVGYAIGNYVGIGIATLLARF